ncbi:hypothetical protein M422DRAFT_48137 [Sphaerobolus stellatus SS14]|uniref:Uncharacterized protein n=1 Tax=Sphaerobolus stellatus (strain SS14) TaxID=990650 RepID=A0A0C9V6Y2_SPHS4|nr:hypothetical protein M422DRAFT_48137 [Sphaerobolus stellatus SS14]
MHPSSSFNPSSSHPSDASNTNGKEREAHPCCLCPSPSLHGLLRVHDAPPSSLISINISGSNGAFVTCLGEGEVWRAHEECPLVAPERWVDEVDVPVSIAGGEEEAYGGVGVGTRKENGVGRGCGSREQWTTASNGNGGTNGKTTKGRNICPALSITTAAATFESSSSGPTKSSNAKSNGTKSKASSSNISIAPAPTPFQSKQAPTPIATPTAHLSHAYMPYYAGYYPYAAYGQPVQGTSTTTNQAQGQNERAGFDDDSASQARQQAQQQAQQRQAYAAHYVAYASSNHSNASNVATSNVNAVSTSTVQYAYPPTSTTPSQGSQPYPYSAYYGQAPLPHPQPHPSQSQAHVQPQAQSQSHAQSQVQSHTQVQAHTPAQPQLQVQPHTQAQPQPQTQFQTQPQMQFQSQCKCKYRYQEQPVAHSSRS